MRRGKENNSYRKKGEGQEKESLNEQKQKQGGAGHCTAGSRVKGSWVGSSPIGAEEGSYRSRTQVPGLPGVCGEVVQDKVAQGLVKVLACK